LSEVTETLRSSLTYQAGTSTITEDPTTAITGIAVGAETIRYFGIQFDAAAPAYSRPSAMSFTVTTLTNWGAGSGVVSLYWAAPLAAGDPVLTDGTAWLSKVNLADQLVGTLTLSSPPTAGTVLTIPITADLNQFNARTANESWTGTMNFYLGSTWTATPGSHNNYHAMAINTSLRPSFTWTRTTTVLTGLSGFQGAQSRADTCLRCGGFVVRETLIHEEDTGLLVCPQCWDEPEPIPVRLRPETPPIND